ncbi:unnamed protein product [Sphagnum tenellum]
MAGAFCSIPLAVSSIPTAFPAINPKEGAGCRWCILPSVYTLGLLLRAHPGHACVAESAFYSTFSSTKSANQRT